MKKRNRMSKRGLRESIMSPSEGVKAFVDYIEDNCYDWGDLYNESYDDDFMHDDDYPRWSAIAYGGNDSVQISIEPYGDGFAAYVGDEEFVDNDPLKLAEVVKERLTSIIDVQETKIMNKKLIRLTEQDLHRIVKESVNRVLKENDIQNLGINNYDPTNYDELSSKIKAIMSKVGEVRNMIRDISTSQIDVAQNASNLDGLAEELYRQLRHTLQKANTNGWVEA